MAVHIAVAEAAFRVAPSLPAWPLVPVPDAWMVAVDVSLGVSAMVVYTALGEWLSGATVGKLLTGLRTVRNSTRNSSLSKCIIQNVSRWSFPRAEASLDIEYPFSFKPRDW